MKPTFAMCPPEYYDYRRKVHKAVNGYVPNAFHGSAPSLDRTLIFQQWNNLKAKIIELGGHVLEVAPREGLLDQVFTADPVLGLSDDTGEHNYLTSMFSHPARQPEQRPFIRLLEEFHDRSYARKPDHRMHIFPAMVLTEGSGDNVYDHFRNVFWSGYKLQTAESFSEIKIKRPDVDGSNAPWGRSDRAAHFQISSWFRVAVNSLEVVKPYFHIDTTLAPLPRGHMLCYRGGLTEESFAKMKEEAFDKYGLDPEEFLIEVDKEDARRFACNIVCFNGRDVITPLISDKLRQTIESKGYKVHMVDVSEFIKGGGGPHCLTNFVNQRRNPNPAIALRVAA